MCKMLFIGTQNKLQEIPIGPDSPYFHLEKISGEFLLIKQNFKNNNTYFVGTSRGCSCDFGIQSNKHEPISIEKIPPIQLFLNNFRKLSGSLNGWEKRHQEKVANVLKEQDNYLAQTLELVAIILDETEKGNPVELFCVWAGDYNTKPEFTSTIDTKKIDLRENFEIAEKEFVTFV